MTFYVFGHALTTTLETDQPYYDAVMWVNRGEPIPPNWIEGTGALSGSVRLPEMRGVWHCACRWRGGP